MKAILFTKKDTAELVEKEVPTVHAGEVLVKMVISTISSGTERANLTGEINVSYRVEDCKEVVWPRQGGYSSSGIVLEVGEGVSSVVPGDRVAMSWSTHQQIVCLPENQVYKLDDDMTFEEAALWHIGTFPIGAIRKCRLEMGESAIVMGQGVLGKFAVVFLKAAGAVPVIAADPVAEKREQALALGADYAFDPTAPDFTERVLKVTNSGVNVAIEVTGFGIALNQVLDCMARFGRVALLGCTRHSDFEVDYYHKVHGPGITLIGAHTAARPAAESFSGWWTTRDDVLCEMKMSKLGRINLSRFIEETHSPAECAEVYGRLAKGGAFPMVQYDWRNLDK